LNGNLLLNIGPNALGQIPEGSVKVLHQLAEWMKNSAESIHKAGMSSFKAPYGLIYTQSDKIIYLHLFTPPMGDIILPELENKIRNITVLGDGTDVLQIPHWGVELLRKEELRIRPPEDLPSMSVLKIELK
jgi:alpha-L-fucosidase